MPYTIKTEFETAYVCKENFRILDAKKFKINRCHVNNVNAGEHGSTTFTAIKFQINNETFILEEKNIDEIIQFLKLIK